MTSYLPLPDSDVSNGSNNFIAHGGDPRPRR